MEGPDFSPVIEAVLELEGCPATEPEKTIDVGFGRKAVLGAAPEIIEAVKAGNLRHYFLIGGYSELNEGGERLRLPGSLCVFELGGERRGARTPSPFAP